MKIRGSIEGKKGTRRHQRILESEECKILWDFPIQTDKSVEHIRPDIIVAEKQTRKCLLIDPSCPFDTRMERKEEEKCTNYNELK